MVDIALSTWPLDVSDEERQNLLRLLSADEVVRAERLVAERARQRFVVARGGLRRILARILDCSPQAVEFTRAVNGKPLLHERFRGPHFNLSHSAGMAAVGVCWNAPVGVDIEAVRPIERGVARRFFHPVEVAALSQLPKSERLEGFFRCWTRKEAVLKAMGEGLFHRPLDSFAVTVTAERAALEFMEREPEARNIWRLQALAPAPGYVGAIACRTGGAPIQLKAALSRGS